MLTLTPITEQYLYEKRANKEMRDNLSLVRLHMSKGSIDDMFGCPIVEFTKEKQDMVDCIVASYKLDECVLLCLYSENSLVAFAVTVNDKKIYKVPPTMYLDSEEFLLDFTYADFFETPEAMVGNVPADNDDSAIYYELHYGHNPGDFNYYLIGNYKKYDSVAARLFFIGQTYWVNNENKNIKDILTEEELNEYETLRKKVKPNVFGMVSSSCIEDFTFFDLLGSSTTCGLLYDDWREDE